jgi:phage/plasmid-associated DNA primase
MRSPATRASTSFGSTTGARRNGKSTTIDSLVLGARRLFRHDRDRELPRPGHQEARRRGDAGSRQARRRPLLRASEPERGAKLNSALIKAATGGEPMSVRALHRGFFDLLPRFKLNMSGNSKPSIPDTDEGIWTRMKLVPWRRHIDKPDEDPFRDKFPEWHEPGAWPKKDTELLDKIKAGARRRVPRLVEGLVDYLEHGFVEPRASRLATADYRDKSDPLARFLRLCTERDGKPGEVVRASRVYAAWCKAAGEKEWSPNGFSDAMIDKGFTKVRSDGMRWEGLRLIRSSRATSSTRRATSGCIADDSPRAAFRRRRTERLSGSMTMTSQPSRLPDRKPVEGQRKAETAENCAVGRRGRLGDGLRRECAWARTQEENIHDKVSKPSKVSGLE